MNEKLCLFCKHCDLTLREPDWSEWTFGNEFGLWCAMQHWVFDSYNTSKLSLAACLQTAETCSDYVLSDAAKERLEVANK